MNRRKFLGIVSTTSLILFAGCTPKSAKDAKPTANPDSAHEHEKGFWTCTMHPQVHKNEPGKCPICGMPLVFVNKKVHEQKAESSAGVEATDNQIKNANISRYQVNKKDFEMTLAVSGRLISPKEVAFQVYESDLGALKTGLSVTGFASTDPSSLKKGRITRIDSLVDPSSRTVRTTAQLDSGVANFIAETSFHGQIQNTLKNQIVVPEEAVLHAGKRDLVYVFTQDGKLEPREVMLGQKSKGEYQILSGLTEGETISAGANFLIDSEAKIRGQ